MNKYNIEQLSDFLHDFVWDMEGSDMAAVSVKAKEMFMKASEVLGLLAAAGLSFDDVEDMTTPKQVFTCKAALMEELEAYRAAGPLEKIQKLAQADAEGRMVELPDEIRPGDKVGDWLIASVDFGSKMERIEEYHLIRESYLEEFRQHTAGPTRDEVRQLVDRVTPARVVQRPQGGRNFDSCPSCGYDVLPQFSYCAWCGQALEHVVVEPEGGST